MFLQKVVIALGAGLQHLHRCTVLSSHASVVMLKVPGKVSSLKTKGITNYALLSLAPMLQHPDTCTFLCRGAVEDLLLTGSKTKVEIRQPRTKQLQKAKKLVLHKKKD